MHQRLKCKVIFARALSTTEETKERLKYLLKQEISRAQGLWNGFTSLMNQMINAVSKFSTRRYGFIRLQILQYLRQIEFKSKNDFSDPIKSICYDYNIKRFYFIFKIGEGIDIKDVFKNITI